MSFIRTSVMDRVAVVVMNRPEVLNALNTQMLSELHECFSDLGEREEIGAIILTGSGRRAFAAGADIKEMSAMGPTEARAFAKLGQSLTTMIEAVPQPVVAAVNGIAFGGGCELALACDIRFCADTAQFAQPEVNLGVIPGWGGTQRLARLCGTGFARRMIYTGEAVDAQVALAHGLAEFICGPDELVERSGELAANLAQKPPIALRNAKELISRSFELDLPRGLALEAARFASCFATRGQSESMAWFLCRKATPRLSRSS